MDGSIVLALSPVDLTPSLMHYRCEPGGRPTTINLLSTPLLLAAHTTVLPKEQWTAALVAQASAVCFCFAAESEQAYQEFCSRIHLKSHALLHL